MTHVYVGPEFELSPKERVQILSQRLINLRNGCGQYGEEERAVEILETEAALRDAYADNGADRAVQAVANG